MSIDSKPMQGLETKSWLSLLTINDGSTPTSQTKTMSLPYLKPDPLTPTGGAMDAPTRLRYAGMPANLAAAAAKNLAKEDATISRFNDVAANIRAPADPAEVAPVAAAPVPPAGPVVDPDLLARHNLLKRSIASNTDPDKPAMYVNPKRRQELQNEFYHVTNLVHQNVLEVAAAAHENLIQQKDIATANAATGLINGLMSIPAKPGTREYGPAYLKVISDHAGALDSAKGKELARLFAEQHDRELHRNDTLAKQQATLQKPNIATTEGADQYYDPQHLLADNPGAEYRQDPKTGGYYVALQKAPAEVPSSITKRYAKLQGDIALHATAAKSQAEKDAKAGLANNPYDKSAQWGAAEKESAELATKYPGLRPSESPEPAVTPSATSSQDDLALQWAQDNPKDPRAAKILALHGK